MESIHRFAVIFRFSGWCPKETIFGQFLSFRRKPARPGRNPVQYYWIPPVRRIGSSRGMTVLVGEGIDGLADAGEGLAGGGADVARTQIVVHQAWFVNPFGLYSVPL